VRTIRAKIKTTATKATTTASTPPAVLSTEHANAIGPPVTEMASRGDAAIALPVAGSSGGVPLVVSSSIDGW
jgi:hypothetical protein